MSFLTVRAFRRRDPNDGRAIYRDFKAPIYIDLDRPPVKLASPVEDEPGRLPVLTNDHHTFMLASLDGTVERMHLLVNWNGEALLGTNPGNEARRVGPDEFAFEMSGLTHGVAQLTVVGVEPSGSWSSETVEVLVRLRARGDVNGDESIDERDALLLASHVGSDVESDGYDPSGDFDDDGDIDRIDVAAMQDLLDDLRASCALMAMDGSSH
jgi:hypothetical protein